MHGLRIIGAVATLAAGLLLAGSAEGKPPHKAALARYYGELLAGRWPGNPDDRPTADQLMAAVQKQEQFSRSREAYAWKPFEPVSRPVVPAVQSRDWVRNPVDAFIAVEHERQGLTPQPEAAKPVLLRRVFLDLIGLPPTAEQLRQFLADDRPDAYDRVVDRLLASPGYGERWGRHWMDVWRYSDWAGWGQQVRDSQPHIWRWRDWIVQSLNQDKGYDRMVLEMLAADEWAPGDADALRATGFLVRNYKRLSRETWMTDTVDHTSRAFLGITLKCAQCHDHMYDPLSQEEYFQFRAVFEPYQVRIDRVPGQLDPNQDGLARVYDADLNAPTYFYLRGDERTPDKDRPMAPGAPELLGLGELPIESVALPVDSYYPALRPVVVEQMLAQGQAEVNSAAEALEKAHSQSGQQQEGTERGDTEGSAAVELAQKKLATARAALIALEARIAAERAKHLDRNGAEDELKRLARAASRAEREAARAKADENLLAARQQLAEARQAEQTDQQKAAEGVEQAQRKLDEAQKAYDAASSAAEAERENYSPLGTVYPQTSSGRRLALARWIVHPGNPLTARVAANHIWARHFGRGLVPTLDNFGQDGQPPTHPALLDWLANELMEPTWAAAADPQRPDGWSMKHLHRLIVTSSTYRTASGNDPECAASDPDNLLLWRTTSRRVEAEVVRDSVLHVSGRLDLTLGGAELACELGLTSPRRSLYFRHAPEKQMQLLALFDMAAPTECYERRESIVPQQALALANSELTIVQARHLARRLAEEAGRQDVGTDLPGYVRLAFEHVLTRGPTEQEVAACVAFLQQQTDYFQQHPEKAGGATDDRHDGSRPAADPALRARENLVHVLMNHHDFITIR